MGRNRYIGGVATAGILLTAIACSPVESQRFKNSGPLYPIALLGAVMADVGEGVAYVASPGEWEPARVPLNELSAEQASELSVGRVPIPRKYIDEPAPTNTAYFYIDESLVAIRQSERVCRRRVHWFVDYAQKEIAQTLGNDVVAVNVTTLNALPPSVRVVALVRTLCATGSDKSVTSAALEPAPPSTKSANELDALAARALVKAGWDPYVVERDLMMLASNESGVDTVPFLQRNEAIRAELRTPR